MEEHLLISKGCKDQGRTLAIILGQGKEIAYAARGIRPPVVDRLNELANWLPIDVFKNGEPPAEEIGLVVIDCGGTLRCGLCPRRGIPTVSLHPTGKGGPLAGFIHGGIYVSGVTPACIEVVWPQGEGGELGIVADDLTGVTTVRVLLACNGLKAAAFFDTESFPRSGVKYLTMVVSSDGRPLPKAEAQHKVSATVKRLQTHGAYYFTKRINAALRDGIGFRIDAMLEQLPQKTVAVAVPAIPQSRCILVDGYSVIDSVTLSWTDVARDVCTPVTESWMLGLLAAQAHHQIGHIALASVMKGEERIQRDLQEQQQRDVRVIMVDAIAVGGIDAIAGAVVALSWNVLAVDPEPFTERLAVRRGLVREARSSAPVSLIVDGQHGSILIVAGSATPTTKRQLQYLITRDDRVYHIPVDAELLVDRKNAVGIEVSRVVQHTRQCVPAQRNTLLVFESALAGQLLDPREEEQRFGLTHGETAQNINRRLSSIVREVLDYASGEVKGLYTTGGNTMVNVPKELGATGIGMIDYVIPQTDMMWIVGGDYAGLICIGKGELTRPGGTIGIIIDRIYQGAQQ